MGERIGDVLLFSLFFSYLCFSILLYSFSLEGSLGGDWLFFHSFLPCLAFMYPYTRDWVALSLISFTRFFFYIYYLLMGVWYFYKQVQFAPSYALTGYDTFPTSGDGSFRILSFFYPVLLLPNRTEFVPYRYLVSPTLVCSGISFGDFFIFLVRGISFFLSLRLTYDFYRLWNCLTGRVWAQQE